jgi:hypothetical protein
MKPGEVGLADAAASRLLVKIDDLASVGPRPTR